MNTFWNTEKVHKIYVSYLAVNKIIRDWDFSKAEVNQKMKCNTSKLTWSINNLKVHLFRNIEMKAEKHSNEVLSFQRVASHLQTPEKVKSWTGRGFCVPYPPAPAYFPSPECGGP